MHVEFLPDVFVLLAKSCYQLLSPDDDGVFILGVYWKLMHPWPHSSPRKRLH